MTRKLKFVLMFLIIFSFLVGSIIAHGKDVVIVTGQKTVTISQALALLKTSPNASQWHTVIGAHKITVLGKNDVLVIEQEDVTIALGLKHPPKVKDEDEDEDRGYGEGKSYWRPPEGDTDEERAQFNEARQNYYMAALYYRDAGNEEKMLEMAELDVEQDISKGDFYSASETAGQMLNDPERAAVLMKKYYEKEIEKGETKGQRVHKN